MSLDSCDEKHLNTQVCTNTPLVNAHGYRVTMLIVWPTWSAGGGQVITRALVRRFCITQSVPVNEGNIDHYLLMNENGKSSH